MSDYRDVPWRQTTAMRNFVIHDYAGVSLDIMWDTAQKDIPQLLSLPKHSSSFPPLCKDFAGWSAA